MSATLILSILSLGFILLCIAVTLAVFEHHFHIFRRGLRHVKDWLKRRAKR